MAADLDAPAMGAILAGIIASQVAVCRFLIREGTLQRDKLIDHLEATVELLRPGVDDARALLPLQQLVAALRSEDVQARLQ